MPRALDHIVWPARDLAALADCFRRLGFTVGRRNRHPWGTENHIIQFDGTFLELLGFAADYTPVAPSEASFPFAGFCEEFLTGVEAGAAMLVLRSDDAAADADRLRREGLGQGRMLPFSRAGQGPDGSDRTVAFTIAFADLPGTPELGAFLCQQHRPENFWNSAAQRHSNGALGIAGLTVGSPAPDMHARVLGRLVDGVVIGTDVPLDGHGRIAVARGGDGRTASIDAVTLRVADLAKIEAALRAPGLHTRVTEADLTVTAPELGSTALVFRGRSD